MAIIKPSGLIQGIKGKLNGSVFQFNSGGNIMRNNRNFNDINSPSWNIQKGRIAWVAGGYRSLDDNDKALWQSATVNYPTTDKWGELRYPSGYELYMRLNLALDAIGEPLLVTPLTPAAITNIAPVTFTFINSTDLQLSWSTVTTSSERIIIYGNKYLSTGRKIPLGGWRKFAEVGPAVTPPANAFYLLEANFGIPPIGARVMIKAVVINENTGQMGVDNYTSLIMA